MKRMLALLLAAVLLMSIAAAETLRDDAYTDVPTAMTQDSVAELFATADCRAETLQPDERSIALLDSVYKFVWEEGNRPARYYDVPTQEKIAALIGGDIDALHMTEAMRLQLSGAPEDTVTVTMRLNVEYTPGQLIVVVLGIPQEDGAYVWYPYRGRVETLGEIKWEIPAADWQVLCLQPISFHVLTDRIGPRGGKLWGYEEYYEQTPPVFSKDAGDVKRMRYWYSEWGEKIEDNFRVWLVDLNDPMQAEVQRIGAHVADGKPILDYFPEDRKAEALLMLPADVAPATLVAYDVIALMAEEYKDTYGDVNVEIVFGTAYDPLKAMVVLAGFVNQDDPRAPFVEWYVLRAEALKPQEGQDKSDSVEIGLKQLFLPDMEERPVMLVVISQELDVQ
ncbi:MAG: hypothetical protein IKK57_01350 [Clostridia bacterium]|nr:hypothetical protein [Clostridia bacterium]